MEDTLQQAREELADHPDLPRLVADGCARVADRWESYNDELREARRWAINLAKRYAADEGIALVPLDELDPNTLIVRSDNRSKGPALVAGPFSSG